MTRWVRVDHEGAVKLGTLTDGVVDVHEGDLFDHPEATGERIPLESARVLTPCEPTKIIGLWNNSRAVATKQGWSEPTEPLYFFKAPSSSLAPGRSIRRPASYGGRVFFEGELGVVIGGRCKDVPLAEAASFIFGYTCVNDVTALELVEEDPSFGQWCRAKSFDTFCPFGPVIATGVEPESLRIVTRVGGKVRQDYSVSDLFFEPLELVHRISRDMTLLPGDVIACGTSTGALPMRAGATVDVEIEGVGTLSNTFAGE